MDSSTRITSLVLLALALIAPAEAKSFSGEIATDTKTYTIDFEADSGTSLSIPATATEMVTGLIEKAVFESQAAGVYETSKRLLQALSDWLFSLFN